MLYNVHYFTPLHNVAQPSLLALLYLYSVCSFRNYKTCIRHTWPNVGFVVHSLAGVITGTLRSSWRLVVAIGTTNLSSGGWCHRADVSTYSRNSSAVPDEQLASAIINMCSPPGSGRWSFRGIDWTVLWSSVFCCCGPVDMEFAARQFVTQLWVSTFSGVSWKLTFSKYWRDVRGALEIFYENALYKLTLYLLT